MSDAKNDAIPGLVIDRSRITHGQQKRAVILKMQLEKADRDGDPDLAQKAFDELDAMLTTVVVAVPDGWLPDGVSLDTPNWMDYLSQAHYQQLAEANSAVPGEKKG